MKISRLNDDALEIAIATARTISFLAAIVGVVMEVAAVLVDASRLAAAGGVLLLAAAGIGWWGWWYFGNQEWNSGRRLPYEKHCGLAYRDLVCTLPAGMGDHLEHWDQTKDPEGARRWT